MLEGPGWKLGLKGEVLGRAALPSLAPAWEDLCANSVEDNVYYSPRYARALLDTVADNENVSFAVVWDERSLVALLPFIRPKFAIPLLRPSGRAWQTNYTFSCMPLLDKVYRTDAAAILVDILASFGGGEWVIPRVNVQGEACRAMTEALTRMGLPWAFSGHFQRAILERAGSFDEHMRRHVSSKRSKDLARNRRRLEQLGHVGHESHRSGEELERAVSAFLTIEAGGWKGTSGTALACHDKTRRFAEQAFTGDDRNSICRADVLTLNGTPIAVSLVTFAGQTGFTVKCTYDEAYRSYGAGLLLEVEVIRSFLSENWASRLDSGTDGAHVIDSLWPGRIEVADLIFSLSSARPELRLAALQRCDQMTRKVKSAIKNMVEKSLRLR